MLGKPFPFPSLVYEVVSKLLLALEHDEHLNHPYSKDIARGLGLEAFNDGGKTRMEQVFNLLRQELEYCRCDRDLILINLEKSWSGICAKEEVA